MADWAEEEEEEEKEEEEKEKWRRKTLLIRPFSEELGAGSSIFGIKAGEGDWSGVTVVVVVDGVIVVMRVVICLLSAGIGVQDGHARGALHASRRPVGKGRAHGGTAFVVIFIAETFAFALRKERKRKSDITSSNCLLLSSVSLMKSY